MKKDWSIIFEYVYLVIASITVIAYSFEHYYVVDEPFMGILKLYSVFYLVLALPYLVFSCWLSKNKYLLSNIIDTVLGISAIGWVTEIPMNIYSYSVKLYHFVFTCFICSPIIICIIEKRIRFYDIAKVLVRVLMALSIILTSLFYTSACSMGSLG